MLVLTEDATEAIEGILAAPGMPEGAGVRITAATPTSGASAAVGLQVALAAVPDESDQVIEEAGARVFLEDIVAELLHDKLLDADRDGEQLRFSIGSAS
jgi:iron-sulfur cluster assembly protein